MRSPGITFALAVCAALFCGVAVWQWNQGGFDALFGAKPTPVGQRLYTSFTADQVRHIRISGNGASASFSLGEKGWQAASPWVDRMDPRAAVGIIQFTLGATVEDFAPVGEIPAASAGLGDAAVDIRLEDARHNPLAKYKLGRSTPWKAEVQGIDQAVPTVFVQPRDKHRKNHIFAATGDINPLFKDGLRFLRDHRPFYFNPTTLQKVRIRSQQGDLTLGRATPESPWRIIKPLDLPTDPVAMKSLLEGIFELHALKLSDRSAVTLPATEESAKSSQIAITPFGTDAETVLDILPPATPDAADLIATVSDRPDTIFHLPVKPEAGMISLSDLPLSANELRDPTLTHLHIPSLRGIAILPATGSAITLSRLPPQPWMVEIAGVSQEANEENLFSLLQAVTTSRATGFESDAATDFTPWGLHRPVLALRFLGQDNQALELRFGLDDKGGCFVNRLGTPTVMRVDPTILSKIAVRSFEWRLSRLWSLNRVHLQAIQLTKSGESPLTLKYSFNPEGWIAERDGQDITATLDPVRANFLLGILEGLKVSRWLSSTDENAAAALKSPTLTIHTVEFAVDDEDETTGVLDRSITLAPAAPGENPGFYYGRLGNDNHPFLLDRETYLKLTLNLLEK
jgi:hypothetical protein